MEPCPELLEVTQRAVDALLNDPDASRHVLLSDPSMTVIGSDDREWWIGFERVEAAFRKQLAELGPGTRLELTESNAFRNGDTGWVATRCNFCFPNGASGSGRMSLVFVREYTSWKVVQGHISIGTPNEDVMGFDIDLGIEAVAASVFAHGTDLTSATASDGTVTLMFSDIEGSTVLLGALGDGAYRDLLAWHHGVVLGSVEAHGGIEANRQGDGFMLAFASARRAVNCALDIQHGLVRERREGMPEVRVRIGIHTGEALRDQDEFFGRTVHYAARVATAAGGTEVLVSDIVRALLDGSDGIAFGESREVELKGFEGVHRLHLVGAP
jgi:class 3 adenylate cyclase